MSRGISHKPVSHSLKISIQMCEPQLCRCWSHTEYEVLVFLFRLCIRPDATHLRPHASHDPAPVYRGQNLSPSCKQADKDNLLDVGAARLLKKRHLTQGDLHYPWYRIRLTTTGIYWGLIWRHRVSVYISIKQSLCVWNRNARMPIKLVAVGEDL